MTTSGDHLGGRMSGVTSCSCPCGALRFEITRPETLADSNCSACRRHAVRGCAPPQRRASSWARITRCPPIPDCSPGPAVSKVT